MTPELSKITQDSDPIASTRLTTTEYLTTLNRLAAQLRVQAEKFQELQEIVAEKNKVRELLKDIMQAAKHVEDSAIKLIGANE